MVSGSGTFSYIDGMVMENTGFGGPLVFSHVNNSTVQDSGGLAASAARLRCPEPLIAEG